MASTTNLKARPKATPSRLQADVQLPQVIVDQEIHSNQMHHLAETEELSLADLPSGEISVPLSFWQEHKAELLKRDSIPAVQLGSDQNVDDLVDDLNDIKIVVLPFVAQVDGRGYSHAHLLRERHGFTGQIRAIGDVKFDQLGFLSRAGCNAFELPESEDYQTALRAFKEFSEYYQPAADGARSIFSRRRSLH